MNNEQFLEGTYEYALIAPSKQIDYDYVYELKEERNHWKQQIKEDS